MLTVEQRNTSQIQVDTWTKRQNTYKHSLL